VEAGVVDGLTFVSNVVHALVWPVTLVVLSLLFRDRFDDLLARLESAQTKAGSLKFTSRKFLDALATVEGFADAVLPPVSSPRTGRPANAESEAIYRQCEKMAARRAGVAVRSAWEQFEASIGNAIVRTGRSRPAAVSLIAEARTADLFDDGVASLATKLSFLGSMLVTDVGAKIGVNEVKRFVALVERADATLPAEKPENG
jgi:hypothetical protein